MKAYKTHDGNIKFEYCADSHTELQLPCGQCIGCRLNHAESWAVRMVHEAQMHDQNSFVTLTYDDKHIPQDGNLNYEDVTKFIKKLRSTIKYNEIAHQIPQVKFKYYRVGEYGEKFSRPHYHIIIFGFDFSTKLIYDGIENERRIWRTKDERRYYISSLLTKLWGLGHAEIGEVDYRTCMYVAKYVTKKINGGLKQSHYQRITDTGEIISVVPEKASMSRRQAIGKQWLENYWTDVYPEDTCIHEAKRLKVPKYYDKWLEKNNPKLLEEVKSSREENTKSLEQAELTREYEVKVLTQKSFIREYDGQQKTNFYDEFMVTKLKDEAISLHKLRKQSC